MDIEKFRERLTNIGVSVSAKTLRRWADDDLIINHREGVAKTGRGNAEDWPPEAVEEAAALWAVKRAAEKRLSPKTTKEIRVVAQRVFFTPQARYEWSTDVDLSGPTPPYAPVFEPGKRYGYGYRVLKMDLRDDDVFGLFDRLVELRKETRRLPGDERLIALLDDKRIVGLLDRFIEHRDIDAIAYVVNRLVDVRIDVPSVLVRTWVAAIAKARNYVTVSSPKKVVFHWYSRPTVEEPEWFERGQITLEEPDPIASIFADFDESMIISEDMRQDEDEIVILVDDVDVRKKVFYAPFDEWNGTEPESEPRALDIYNVCIEVFDQRASLAFTRPEQLPTPDEIFEQRALGYAYLIKPEKEIVRYIQSGQLNALALAYNDLLDCVEAQGAIDKNGWYLVSAKIARAVERHPAVVHALFADVNSER